jgi:hypothetical protein
MKLIIAAMRDRPVPGKSQLLNMPLDKRVEYALNCLDAGDTSPEHQSQAREFLTKARAHLDETDPQHKKLLTQIDEALT